ncbi:MAG: response regulator [Eubacteriales bacterium]
MKIAIVDDFDLDRMAMKDMVKEYFDFHSMEVEFHIFHSGEEFLEHYQVNAYQIVILDIYMIEKNGMEIATHIRGEGDTCKILFATSSQDFAVESYEVGATYYILKPIQKERVEKALDLCMKRKKAEKTIEVICDRLPLQIIISSIYWVETLRNVLIIHLEEQEIKTYMTFQGFLVLLEGDQRFMVSCKGCIVNMEYIDEIMEYDFKMKNGDYVQIRKRGANQVKADYLQYMCRKNL